MAFSRQIRQVADQAGLPTIECNCGYMVSCERAHRAFGLFMSHLVGQHEDGDDLVQALPKYLRLRTSEVFS